MRISILLVCGLQLAPTGPGSARPVPDATFFVATNGNDHWTGQAAAPNTAHSDGPFRTLQRAREALRQIKRTRPIPDLTVVVRGGTYHLPAPLVFTPEDSGTPERPVRFVAYPGENPVLSGGRPVTGWRRSERGLWKTRLPDVRAGKWYFRQLRVGDRMQHQARYPDYDPDDPIEGGWLLADDPAGGRKGGFGGAVGSIHNRGDFIEWTVDVPADGDYCLWLYAGVNMKPFGRDGMAGQTGFSIDGNPPVILDQGPIETGNWRHFLWSRCATLPLEAGRRRLRWVNLKGGGIDFDAFCLTDDVRFVPEGTRLAPPAPGKHLMVVQAEDYVTCQGKQLRVTWPRVYDRLTYPPNSVKPWPLSPDKEIHIFPAWGWVNSIDRIGRIDERIRTIFFAPPCQADLRVGNRFFIANVREALDAAGEFYLDKKTGILTYLPEVPDFTQREIVAPAMKQILIFRGTDAAHPTEYIQFRGFTFRDSQYSVPIASLYKPPDGAVLVQDAAHTRIQDCTFELLGGWALVAVGAADSNQFVGNTVRNVGQGGVFLCGQSGKDRLMIGNDPRKGGIELPGARAAGSGPTGNLVAGNHIHHIGLVYKHVAGVSVETAHQNVIVNNFIHDTPRYGISLKRKCRDNRIEFNEVRRTNLETNDTGAIETYTTTTPNLIKNNLVVDSIGLKVTEDKVWHSPFYAWGIYLDGYSSNQTVTDNVCLRTVLGGIMVNGGWNNRIENNIFANGSEHLVTLSNYLRKYHGNRFLHNIVCSTLDPVPDVRITNWGPNLDFEIDHNLYWLKHGAPPVFSGTSWTEWRSWGFDRNSEVADPKFSNLAKEDFRFATDSPARRLGIHPIDLSKVGLRGYMPPR